MLLLSPAWGAYTLASPPSGWGGSAGAWTFGGTPAANAPWVNGSAAGGVSVNVGGRAVTMPMTMRLAANAPEVIARAALATPYGRAASFIAWAVAAGWVWDSVSERWAVPGTVPAQSSSIIRYCISTTISCQPSAAIYYTPQTACAAVASVGLVPRWIPDINYGQCQFSSNGTSYNVQRDVGAATVVAPNCAGAAPDANGNCPTGVNEPADQADADALPAAVPMPAAAPSEAQPYVPLPVQLPELDPVRVPLGDPVPVPNTSPQAYEQPVADLRPSPTTDEPFRVDIQPRTVTGTSPSGVTDVQHLDGSEAPSEAASEPSLCDLNPDASACLPLGLPGPAGVIPTWDVSLSFESPVAFGPSDAACPPPRQMVTSLAGTLEFDYAGACMFADGVRPVVIALAYLASVLAFFGIGSRD